MGLRTKKTLLDQAEGYVETAIDQAKEFMQDTALPALSDAREKAAPVVAAGAATVADKATQARGYAEAKAAELSGSKPKKRSKLKTMLMFGALAGAVAFVAKKMQRSGGDGGGWQSSYEPAPPPSPASSVPSNGTEPTAETDPSVSPVEISGDPLSDPLPPETGTP